MRSDEYDVTINCPELQRDEVSYFYRVRTNGNWRDAVRQALKRHERDPRRRRVGGHTDIITISLASDGCRSSGEKD